MKNIKNEEQLFEACKNIKENKGTLDELLTQIKYNSEKIVKLNEKRQVAQLVQIFTAPNTEIDDFYDKIFEDYGIEKKKDNAEDILSRYEVVKTLSIISEYIGITINVQNWTEENYDLLNEIGFLNRMYDNKDFVRFNDFVDSVTGAKYFSLMETINDVMNNIPNQEKLEEFGRTIKDIDLSDEKIEKIIKILNFNDPLNAEIKEATTIKE